MLFVTKVAPIISYFFLLRQKKKKERKKDSHYQYPRFLLRALSHPTVTAFPNPPKLRSPFPSCVDALSWNQHRSRFSRWSASSLLSRCSDTRPRQISTPIGHKPLTTEIHANPMETEYGPGLCSSPKGNLFFCLCYTTSALQSYWLQFFTA